MSKAVEIEGYMLRVHTRYYDRVNGVVVCYKGENDKMFFPLKARPHGKWIEDSDDYDVRCSHCGLAIHALNKTNHEMLNVLTGGKWWTHYRYCPMCGSINGGEAE